MQFYKNFNLIHNTFDSFIYYLIFYLKIFFISCINKIKFFISLLSTKKLLTIVYFVKIFQLKYFVITFSFLNSFEKEKLYKQKWKQLHWFTLNIHYLLWEKHFVIKIKFYRQICKKHIKTTTNKNVINSNLKIYFCSKYFVLWQRKTFLLSNNNHLFKHL